MRVYVTILATAALAGCASYNVAVNGNTTAALPATDFPAARASELVMQPVGTPQFVLPVTGGAMILALPLGGSVFLPLDGGPPVTALAVSP